MFCSFFLSAGFRVGGALFHLPGSGNLVGVLGRLQKFGVLEQLFFFLEKKKKKSWGIGTNNHKNRMEIYATLLAIAIKNACARSWRDHSPTFLILLRRACWS